MDSFCICFCLIICLPCRLEGAEVDDTVGGQVFVDASDSSVSVIDGDERLRLCDGCKASAAFEAAFRFGRVGGSVIAIDVSGRVIGVLVDKVFHNFSSWYFGPSVSVIFLVCLPLCFHSKFS